MAGEIEPDDWDVDDDFDLDAGFAKTPTDDRWEGEDEDLKEKLKIEEEKEKTKTAGQTEVKKTKVERIEEKKAQRRIEELKKATEKEKELSPEEQAAEKQRLEQIQKDADLEVAKALFGVTTGSTSIDEMNPKTPEEFDQLLEALKNKFHRLEASPHYVGFIDNLIRTACAGLDPEDLRKIGGILQHMASEKQKAAKTAKTKKKGKATLGSVGKAAKKVDIQADAFGDLDVGIEGDYQYDDFM